MDVSIALAQSRARVSLALAGAGLALWLAYLVIFLPFLPNERGEIGIDYWLHLPNLLAGYYWYRENGFWAVPWFTPAECGGFAYFADPNVGYYSLPQLLTVFVSPVQAVRASFAAFAAIGLACAYGLMRSSFAASRSAALAAGGLFLFNGFFTYRMLAGHLTFHAFALLPGLAWALLPQPTSGRLAPSAIAWRIGAAALILSYMFQTGMVHGIPPAMLSIATLLLVHGLIYGWRLAPWAIGACAGVLSLALCAAKLAAELALLANFPRDGYNLPGVDSLLLTIWLGLMTLLSYTPQGLNPLTNAQWLMTRHEWEYGVSVAPLVLLLALAFKNSRREHSPEPPSLDRIFAYGALGLICAIPIGLNYYQPGWNAFLKSLPYIANSSSMLRFFSAFILPVVVIAGLSLDQIADPLAPAWRGRPALAGLALALMLAQNILTPRDHYAEQNYPIGQIEDAYRNAEVSGSAPPITQVGDDAGGLGRGESTLRCYQPLFGYRLEHFPKAPLQPGPISLRSAGVLNLKNPACYIFPAENACKPGDHFGLAQSDDAAAFAHYRPFPFTQSSLQKAANWLNGATLIAFAAGFVWLALLWLASLGRARSSPKLRA